MTPDQLRQAYLDFFEKRDHAVLPSASLVPENDPTTLFTGSGMQPLLPYFLGQPHPKGQRVVNSQKCFRSQDIDEVGDNRHTTFFEMWGNWSFGDYFKTEQLEWIFTFLTTKLELDPEKLYVTVYEGNEELGIPQDQAAVELWQKLFSEKGVEAKAVKDAAQNGLQNGRIFYYGSENWWSRVGAPSKMPEGEPGGPDSEIFYDFEAEAGFHENSKFADQPCHVNCDCGRFLEIGNSVFMTYVRTKDGFEELSDKNIDFGGGFERILAAVNDEPDIFQTQLFQPLIEQLEAKAGRKYGQDLAATRAYRIITDHIRAAVMLAADGVFPDNKEQGYFLRRLIRRALRYAHLIGIETRLIDDLVPIVAEIYRQPYPKIERQQAQIQACFSEEEDKFKSTLKRGLAEFEKLIDQTLTAKQAFKLYETYGFPLEMSLEEAEQQGLKLEPDLHHKFKQEQEEHAQQSRQASKGKFEGGLKDQEETTIHYHTATHLLLAALKQVLDSDVKQGGSNITGQRLRFDFSWPEALTKTELKQIETQINAWIEADLPMIKQLMSKQQALKVGATAHFLDRYPDEVIIYTIGHDVKDDWISKEFCGGPHAKKTGQLLPLEIYKEKSSGSGVRRIYARFVQP